MKIEIVGIGDELLRGSTINTNASFIGRELARSGYLVSKHTVLPDDEDELAKGLTEAIEQNDLVITTGGLGPTVDDRTREIVAHIYNTKLIYNKTVGKSLAQRFGKNFPTIENQATIPENAKPLLNRVGTAPGLIFEEKNCTLIVLPGVPSELDPMFSDHVLPYVQKNFPLDSQLKYRWMFLTELYESHVDPLLRELNKKYPAVSFGIYPGIALLHLSLTSKDTHSLNRAWEELNKAFHDYLYEAPHGKIEEAVQIQMVNQGITLACAESCTGGSISAKLTSLPGSSDYFLGSVVSYSNALKQQFLDVSESTLKKVGSVSPEVAREMWDGLCKTTTCDYAIAVTGIAGPSGGSKEKPVGTVWAAVGKRGTEPKVWNIAARGNRCRIIEWAVNTVLGTLYHQIDASDLNN